jgi:hypothetical protein
MGLSTGDLLTPKQDFAAAGFETTADQIEHCCLTGAIWTYQSDYLPFIDCKVNPSQGAGIAKLLAQFLQL